ncbi:Na+ H+ antiporter, putative [Ichthyophthirius multifiliis]|uniref:Sodium/hydrogen exchanger n=1 Tax=Ichthyophthirius multifiliis TaxID=5932 RepID=G0QLF0_ICHMU|nr:Na+ H+ antiporter, putative [Ichthyophthirius multifiliis]EGR33957.1 Na+ H+ antiporter, putative [Ichthyophthirius multifiliis]|eukprot:XP_004039261.1 Na+ H+ antiporter, putative [Ichthyophthirius multifiliis]
MLQHLIQLNKKKQKLSVNIHLILIKKKKITFLHESSISIFLGALFGLIIQLIIGKKIEFNHEIFFNLILPPIIFAGGFNIRRILFFQNFFLITYYGIIGTIITFIIISILTIQVQNITFIIKFPINTSELLLFSSVLCATDTVTALSLVKVNQFPQLNSILFGEGIINDAISIVIFRSIKNYVTETDQNMDISKIILICLDFLKLLFGSIFLGISIGLLISLFFKKFTSFSLFPLKEMSIIFICGYFSYLIAEVLHFSGIISLFCCGLIMGHYTYLNISKESQKGTHLSIETIGYLAEAFVFVYLGVSLLNVNYSQLQFMFAIYCILSMFIARFTAIFSLNFINYIFKREQKLNKQQLLMVWYSGNIRGAVSFGLILMFQSENIETLVTVVLLIIIFTTFILGSLMQIYGKKIGLKNEECELKINNSNNSIDSVDNKLQMSKFNQKLANFEEQYMKPIFTNNIYIKQQIDLVQFQQNSQQ